MVHTYPMQMRINTAMVLSQPPFTGILKMIENPKAMD